MAIAWAEFLAEHIHRRARVPGPPYDVFALACAMGYEVRLVADLGGPVGMLAGRVIAVLARASHSTRVLTVAHELVHAVDDELRAILHRPTPIPEEEIDAAAAALLMPLYDVAALVDREITPAGIVSRFGPMPLLAAVERIRAIASR